MKILKRLSIMAIILCIILLLLSIFFIIFPNSMDNFGINKSIGIIGGADGPTAIFIQFNMIKILYGIFNIVVLSFCCVVLALNIKKNNRNEK